MGYPPPFKAAVPLLDSSSYQPVLHFKNIERALNVKGLQKSGQVSLVNREKKSTSSVVIMDDNSGFLTDRLTAKIHFLLTYSQACPRVELDSLLFFSFLREDLTYLKIAILPPLVLFFSKLDIPSLFKQGMAWFLLNILALFTLQWALSIEAGCAKKRPLSISALLVQILQLAALGVRGKF